MSEQYTHIRVRVSTRDRLRAECNRYAQAVLDGHIKDDSLEVQPINPKGTGISMDTLIRRMLDQRALQKERVRRSRKRARKGGAK